MAAVSIAGSIDLVVSNTYHSRIHKQDRADSKYEPEWKNFKGSHILTILKQCPQINRIHAFSRRDLPTHPKLVTINTQNPTDWPYAYTRDTSVFITALGTTARIAGSIAQRCLWMEWSGVRVNSTPLHSSGVLARVEYSGS
jgi:hypothetical protein